MSFQAVRVRDLTKVFGGHYGGGKFYQFPDDDSGRDDLHILLDHYAYANPLAMLRVVKARAPWMSDAERDDLLDEVNRHPRRWTAQALADALRLTYAERQARKIRTIGAVDVTPRQRKRISKERKKELERDRQRAKRHGLRTRARYLADVKGKEPWAAEGMSRATWYRRRKADTVRRGVRRGMLEIKRLNHSNTPSLNLASLKPSLRKADTKPIRQSALRSFPPIVNPRFEVYRLSPSAPRGVGGNRRFVAYNAAEE